MSTPQGEEKTGYFLAKANEANRGLFGNKDGNFILFDNAGESCCCSLDPPDDPNCPIVLLRVDDGSLRPVPECLEVNTNQFWSIPTTKLKLQDADMPARPIEGDHATYAHYVGACIAQYIGPEGQTYWHNDGDHVRYLLTDEASLEPGIYYNLQFSVTLFGRTQEGLPPINEDYDNFRGHMTVAVGSFTSTFLGADYSSHGFPAGGIWGIGSGNIFKNNSTQWDPNLLTNGGTSPPIFQNPEGGWPFIAFGFRGPAFEYFSVDFPFPLTPGIRPVPECRPFPQCRPHEGGFNAAMTNISEPLFGWGRLINRPDITQTKLESKNWWARRPVQYYVGGGYIDDYFPVASTTATNPNGVIRNWNPPMGLWFRNFVDGEYQPGAFVGPTLYHPIPTSDSMSDTYSYSITIQDVPTFVERTFGGGSRRESQIFGFLGQVLCRYEINYGGDGGRMARFYTGWRGDSSQNLLGHYGANYSTFYQRNQNWLDGGTYQLSAFIFAEGLNWRVNLTISGSDGDTTISYHLPRAFGTCGVGSLTLYDTDSGLYLLRNFNFSTSSQREQRFIPCNVRAPQARYNTTYQALVKDRTYSFPLTISAMKAPYTVVMEGEVPKGMVVNTTDGTWHGTPNTVQPLDTFAVTVTDVNGLEARSEVVSWKVTDFPIQPGDDPDVPPPTGEDPPPDVDPPGGDPPPEEDPPPTSEFGFIYNWDWLDIPDGTGIAIKPQWVNNEAPPQPWTFSLEDGAFPTGYNVNVSTGEIAGVTTGAQIGYFRIKCVDNRGRVAYWETPWEVGPGGSPPLSISYAFDFTTLARLSSYNEFPTVVGATGPTTFSVISGTIPNTMAFDTSTGEVHGVPFTAGSGSMTIQVDDGTSTATTVEPWTIT